MSRIAGFKALIVGCGAIAGGYDEKLADDEVRTHAKAYGLHPDFTPAACVEPDPERRRRFMARWGVARGYAGLDEVAESFDVASLCSPTACHAGQLERLLAMDVRLIFAEKPLTADFASAARLVEKAAAAGRRLAVNYLRRWAPEMAALKSEIAAGHWGRLQRGQVLYGKGLLNNGSHAIDLLAFLFGPLALQAVGDAVSDGRADDPTLSLRLATAEGAALDFLATDHRRFGLFEMDLIFEEGRVSLPESGMLIRRKRAGDNPLLPGYRSLVTDDSRKTGLDRAFLAALDNIAAALNSGAALASDGTSALVSLKICEEAVLRWRRKDEG